jgi:ribosomal protein L24E
LNETCFYCGHEAEKGTYVTFYEKDLEHDEFLCRECYAEWLESMKG